MRIVLTEQAEDAILLELSESIAATDFPTILEEARRDYSEYKLIMGLDENLLDEFLDKKSYDELCDIKTMLMSEDFQIFVNSIDNSSINLTESAVDEDVFAKIFRESYDSCNALLNEEIRQKRVPTAVKDAAKYAGAGAAGFSAGALANGLLRRKKPFIRPPFPGVSTLPGASEIVKHPDIVAPIITHSKPFSAAISSAITEPASAGVSSAITKPFSSGISPTLLSTLQGNAGAAAFPWATALPALTTAAAMLGYHAYRRAKDTTLARRNIAKDLYRKTKDADVKQYALGKRKAITKAIDMEKLRYKEVLRSKKDELKKKGASRSEIKDTIKQLRKEHKEAKKDAKQQAIASFKDGKEKTRNFLKINGISFGGLFKRNKGMKKLHRKFDRAEDLDFSIFDKKPESEQPKPTEPDPKPKAEKPNPEQPTPEKPKRAPKPKAPEKPKPEKPKPEEAPKPKEETDQGDKPVKNPRAKPGSWDAAARRVIRRTPKKPKGEFTVANPEVNPFNVNLTENLIDLLDDSCFN